MDKKKRSYEEILEDIRNYKPKMTKGEPRRVFMARMMGAIITDSNGNVIDDDGNIIDGEGNIIGNKWEEEHDTNSKNTR